MDSEVKEALLKQYLLGRLEENEQQRLEQRLLTEDDCFEELLIAEDELIDGYLEGTLSDDERERFEHRFLATAEHKRALSFAKSLNSYVRLSKSTQSSAASEPFLLRKRFSPVSLFTQKRFVELSFATAAMIVLAGVSWLIVKELMRDRSGHVSEDAVVAANLIPGLQRGTGEIKRVVIPAGVSTLRLMLELEQDEAQSYRAVVQTDEGREVLTAAKLESETIHTQRAVILNISSKLLTGGDYQVTLSGLAPGGSSEEIAKYYFRVIRSG